MGSHSVTCHPSAVTFPPLPQPKPIFYLATQEGCKAELTPKRMLFVRLYISIHVCCIITEIGLVVLNVRITVSAIYLAL